MEIQQRRGEVGTVMFHGVVENITRLGLDGVQDAVVIRRVLLVVGYGVGVVAGRLRLNIRRDPNK